MFAPARRWQITRSVTPLTRNEREWVAEIRDASGGSDLRLTMRSRAKLREIFGR